MAELPFLVNTDLAKGKIGLQWRHYLFGSDDGKVYAFHSQEETSCVLCGDANQDGVVDIFDALLVSEYDAGLKTLNDIPGLLCCDVDNNGEVDIFDALEISKYDAQIIAILNCEWVKGGWHINIEYLP